MRERGTGLDEERGISVYGECARERKGKGGRGNGIFINVYICMYYVIYLNGGVMVTHGIRTRGNFSPQGLKGFSTHTDSHRHRHKHARILGRFSHISQLI